MSDVSSFKGNHSVSDLRISLCQNCEPDTQSGPDGNSIELQQW